MSASAFRCPVCLTNWPPTGEFAVCPECRQETSPMSSPTPIPVGEAVSRKRYADFEVFYADREARLLAQDIDRMGVA